MRVILLPFAAALLFVTSAEAAQTTATHAASVPTVAAEAYWKQVALKPAHLNAWFRGYLNHPSSLRFRNCKIDRGQGVPSYDCKIGDIFATTAFGYLVRDGGCDYSYLIGSVDGKHQITRSFTFCG